MKQQYCPSNEECGGCQFIDMPYDEQLKQKQKYTEDVLSGICSVDPIIAAKNPYNYRNKAHYVFGSSKKGGVVSGIYQENTHKIIPVESCLIQNEIANRIMNTVRGLVSSFKMHIYNEDTGDGFLRHVIVRVSSKGDNVMVILVAASPIFFSKNNFVKALVSEHPEIHSVVLNVNDKKTTMVMGEKNIDLYGPGCIRDSLCGYNFKISAGSFYQVNHDQAEVLYNKAIELANISSNDTVIDAFCGIGTIGIIASKFAKKVIGIELNYEAVRDAKSNARLNEIKNIKFYNDDAGRFINRNIYKGISADVVFMDPPRGGSSLQFLNALCNLGPKKIVYISCNPETLARDLEFLSNEHYKPVKACPVDMFPMTKHVETVVLLERC